MGARGPPGSAGSPVSLFLVQNVVVFLEQINRLVCFSFFLILTLKSWVLSVNLIHPVYVTVFVCIFLRALRDSLAPRVSLESLVPLWVSCFWVLV